MTQSWLIFSGLFTVVLSARSASLSGSCASIGYSTSCCPPWKGDACLAVDGNCNCATDCHFFHDCCEDVHCPLQRRTCADIGITQCCHDPTGSGFCNVYDEHADYQCSCDVSCHARKDCCSDAKIFCKPCDDAKKYPECYQVNRNNALACYAPKGNCYCDPLCGVYGDCCTDAQNSSSLLSKSRLQSSHNDRIFNRRRFYNRERRIYQQEGNANYAYQEAPAARVQQEFINERGFRSRPRVAGRPSA